MRTVHISSVKSGDRLAKPIYSENGNVLLGVGVELSERFIERLKALGVDILYLEDKNTEDIYPEEVVRSETRKKAVESIYKTMTSLMDQPTHKERPIIPEIGSTFRKVFGDILGDLINRKGVLVHLTDIHTADGYLFQHSVNVAILAGVIGISKGYNRKQLEELGIGAMLFDIGMTQIPKDLWTKKGKLTNEEIKIVQSHTEYGFNMLRTQHDVPLISAHCALQHHEQYNGSGYPRQLKNKEIHEYAQIVAIADVYDALTSPRGYRNRYTPSDAMEYLFAAGNRQFDIELIKLFCSNISIYPIASTVLLNTGQTGVVSANNPLAVHRPVIRIIKEADGTSVTVPSEIELGKNHNITIINLL